ncbi:PAS domain-containing sensor histidine kinase [Spirosoma pollinicola]|uniref:histidine kinase n=1 Tax=Spirosoma pollinicola TaxID=2057025 RepID=A0A2K8Z9K8_9BACT|nr:PAS domain-containing protein [Spirosoma pollinicola]AUD06562.1 PAS domain-containing sensor histidine kinase [Spirosoma pollinicola]
MTGDQRPLDRSKQLTERLDINLALQAADLGVWEIDLPTNQVLLDQRCCQLFGITSHQLSFSDTLHHIHPDDVEGVNQAMQWALNPQSDGNYQVSYRSIGQDGRTHWIRSTGRRYLDQRGQPIRLAGVSQELTQQVEAQQQEAAALQQSEDRFRVLIEEAPVATCLFVGRQLVIEVANQAMIQVWGKGPDVIGLPLAEALPELKDQHFLTTLDELFTTGKTYQAKGGRADLVIEGQLQTFYFNYDFKPLRTPGGEVYAILETAQDVTEQVLAQQRVEQSQQQLLTLFEQSPVGLATISASDELVFQWANSFYGELVARPPQDIVGKPLLDALPELTGQGFDEILKNVIATGNPFVAPEVAVGILRDGQLTTIYVDLTYQPQKGALGAVEAILVVATDVTQQVVTRKQIEESESKLRAIVATAPAGIGVFVGRDLVIENPNQTFIDIVGKGPHIAGLPLREVMPELLTEVQPFLQILDDVFTTGNSFISPSSLVKIVQNGVLTDNYYNISYSPIRNAAGEVYAILDIAIDVTEAVIAQQQLKVSEAFAQNLLYNSPVANVVLLGEDMLIHSINEGMLAMLGRDNSIIGMPFIAAMPELEPTPLLGRLRQVLTTGEAFQQPEERFELVRYGQPHTGYYQYIYTALRDALDQPTGVVITAIEVTTQVLARQQVEASEARYRTLSEDLEQQVLQRTQELAATNEELAANNEELEASNEEYAALNEELEEANSLLIRSNDNLQTFAYVASHDLQEPLRKIQQFGDLLRQRSGSTLGDGLPYLERMQAAASRMSALIRDLLTFSRISTQRDTSGPVALPAVIQVVLTDLELVIDETGARIEVDDLPTLEGDRSQLEQLFQNLISNALKFRKPGVVPLVQIRSRWLAAEHLPPTIKPARRAVAYHQLEVIDNGIGFDEKYLDRIFQVFQRLHGKSEYAGTGIGLAICAKVVTNHGGAISARSQPGQGAAFTIYLPV